MQEEADLVVSLLTLGASIARLIMRLTATPSGRGGLAVRCHWMHKYASIWVRVVGEWPQLARDRIYTAPWQSLVCTRREPFLRRYIDGPAFIEPITASAYSIRRPSRAQACKRFLLGLCLPPSSTLHSSRVFPEVIKASLWRDSSDES